MGCTETRDEIAERQGPNIEEANDSQVNLEEQRKEAQKWKALAQENITRLQDVSVRFSEMTKSHDELHRSYKQLEVFFKSTLQQLEDELQAKAKTEQDFKASQASLAALMEENESLMKETAEVQQLITELSARQGNHKETRH
jgi:predicted DNA-binding ArsR family transcriptional regulator